MTRIGLLALACAGAVRAATVDHAGWLPFYMPWDDSSSNATDLSSTVEAPAGKRGFVQVGEDGRFRFQDGTRARFVGFTSVAGANLPDSADAPRIAARLRRFGVNFMRLHLMDVEGAEGLFANSSTGTRTLDPAKMRRLDWFVKCLEERGIYVNFCVQAGRVFKTGDGAPAPVTNDQSKLVSLFDPVLIGLQKELATRIATHVNPFTGLAYKDDPAVATWELTNENQLFMGWLSWGSSAWDSASDANSAGMGGYYHRELDSLWNAWLRAKHGGDSALRAAWAGSGGAATEMLKNTSFETGTSGWSWWANADAGASMTVRRVAGGASSGYALQVAVGSQGASASDASVIYSRLSVAKGKSYRLRFLAKGTEPTTVSAEFLKESVWTWYGSSTCSVDTVWSLCESFLSAPTDIADSLRFNIGFGLTTGTVRIDSASFVEYGGDGLREGESLVSATVRRSSRSTVSSLSEERAREETRFYADLEGRYVDTLVAHLRGSIGIRVPITFTNNWYGLASIASQSRADYMDAHWYWQHPSFPAGWSSTNYSIGNTPMVSDPAGGTVAQFSWSRVAGKPFVGSEYNHPFPSQYLCETPAFYWGYMGFLDADGALLHAYVDYTPHYRDTWNDQFFNVGTNPVLMTQMPLAALFRAGRIAPATVQTTVDVSTADWERSVKRSLDGFPFDGSWSATLATPMRWGRFDAESTTPPSLPDPGTTARSNTGELAWDRSAGILSIDNPWWQGAVGFLSKGVSTSRLRLSGVATTSGRDFAAIHLASVDTLPIGRSRRMLLMASARIENKSTVWNSSFTALTRIYRAGDTVVCEPVTGTVTFDPGRTDSVSVFALDPRGARVRALPLGREPDGKRLSFDLPGTSLWYEIAVGETASPIALDAPRRAATGSVRLLRGPRAPTVEWSASAPGVLAVEQIDARGRVLSRTRTAVAAGRGAIRLEGTGFRFVRARLEAEPEGRDASGWIF